MSDFFSTTNLIANGGLGLGSGRVLPTVAAAMGLMGVIIGALILARRCHPGRGRAGAILVEVLGLISLVIGGLHAANSAGGFGTGNGLAGALVAIVLGLVGMGLGGLALTRYRRSESTDKCDVRQATAR